MRRDYARRLETPGSAEASLGVGVLDLGALLLMNSSHRVVIIGGGFGGLYAARALKHAPVQVTLLDRRNFHLFQPLLYQLATGSLAPGDIASPLRLVLKRQKTARVLLGEAVGFNVQARKVLLRDGEEILYDTLVVS